MKLKTQNLKLKTLLVLCLLSVVCTVCSATDWYVSESGAGSTNGTSPENAWERVELYLRWTASYIQPGDTLYVIGTFQNIVVGGSGTEDNYITITGYDANTVITGSTSLQGNDWIKISSMTCQDRVICEDGHSENVWFDHLTMDGASILLYDCNYVRVSYCDLTGGGIGNSTTVGGNDNYITIDHCTITDVNSSIDSHCIGVNGGNHWLIEYNELSYGNTGVTFYGNNVNYNVVRYNNIHHMEASRSTGDLGQQRGYGIGWEGSLSASSVRKGNYVYYNTIHHLTGNSGTSIPACGIRAVFDDSDNYVFNNTFYDCSPSIRAEQLTVGGILQPIGGTFRNNICLSPNDSSDSGDEKNFVLTSDNLGDLVISNNCYYHDSNDLTIKATTYNFAGWQAALVALSKSDTSSISSNPLLTNADANDFSLTSSSPCIDIGAWVGILTDKNGNSMSYNPDMGAIEVQQNKKYAKIRR